MKTLAYSLHLTAEFLTVRMLLPVGRLIVAPISLVKLNRKAAEQSFSSCFAGDKRRHAGAEGMRPAT